MKPTTNIVWGLCGIWWSNGRGYDQETDVLAGKKPRSTAEYYRPLVGLSFLRNTGKVHVPEGRILLMKQTLFFP
jgi:hypothetical protein